MNLPPKSLSLALLLGLTTFLASCNHTPVRPATPPTPDQTGTTVNPGGPRPPTRVIQEGPGPVQPTAPDLTTRDTNDPLGDRLPLQAQAVYFGFDSSVIRPAEAAKLQAVVKYLNEHPEAHLLIEGHCDWRGTAEYNLGLGDRRSTAVKQYLVRLKVPAARLDTLSKGSIGAPEKATEEQMAKDRRVEFLIQKAGAAPGALPL